MIGDSVISIASEASKHCYNRFTETIPGNAPHPASCTPHPCTAPWFLHGDGGGGVNVCPFFNGLRLGEEAGFFR